MSKYVKIWWSKAGKWECLLLFIGFLFVAGKKNTVADLVLFYIFYFNQAFFVQDMIDNKLKQMKELLLPVKNNEFFKGYAFMNFVVFVVLMIFILTNWCLGKDVFQVSYMIRMSLFYLLMFISLFVLYFEKQLVITNEKDIPIRNICILMILDRSSGIFSWLGIALFTFYLIAVIYEIFTRTPVDDMTVINSLNMKSKYQAVRTLSKMTIAKDDNGFNEMTVGLMLLVCIISFLASIWIFRSFLEINYTSIFKYFLLLGTILSVYVVYVSVKTYYMKPTYLKIIPVTNTHIINAVVIDYLKFCGLIALALCISLFGVDGGILQFRMMDLSTIGKLVVINFSIYILIASMTYRVELSKNRFFARCALYFLIGISICLVMNFYPLLLDIILKGGWIFVLLISLLISSVLLYHTNKPIDMLIKN